MKTRYILPILLSAAAVLAACNKEQAVSSGTESGELVTLEASLGEPGTKIHFTGDNGSYTEAKWEADDCIWVRSDTQPYWEAGDCFTTSAADISSDGHSAKFTGRTRKDGKMSAVYPYNLVSSNSNNDLVTLEIPDTQSIVPGDCAKHTNPAIAFWADGSSSFAMNYVFGAVKFSLKGEGLKVSSFELLDANSSNHLWGPCDVQPDYEAKGIKSIVMHGGPASGKLSLVPEGEITLGATPYEFYVMLPEGSLSDGFVLKALDQSGKTIAKLMSGKANTIVRGKVVKMPTAVMKEATPEEGGSLEGSGIEADPYLINTAEDLNTMAKLINAEETYEQYADKVYKQTAAIDFNMKEFSPVSHLAAKPFKGKYDGQGFNIGHVSTSGYDAQNPASGLFAYAENATFSNIVVAFRNNTGNFNRVGGIVGYAKNCTISNCEISRGSLSASANMCAGIVADMDGGTISNCKASLISFNNSKNYAGAIVAHAHGGATISDCSVKSVQVSGGNEIGGIVGKLDAGSISSCSIQNTKVTATEEDAGGIVGWCVEKSSIKDCSVSDNSVITAGKYYAGGIVGLVQLSTLENCNVEASEIGGSQRNGGIAGYMKVTPSTFINCSVSNGSKVTGSLNIGGITGWMDLGTIKGCSFVGSTIDATGDGAGGIVGRAISKSGGDNVIDGCWIEQSEIKGTYSVAGIVGYAYPDANGVLIITNSGVKSGTVHPTLCDTGGDPAKGDCMCGGIVGWMRLKDSGSKAYVYNCYSYLSGGFVCDLPMVHPSVGGLVGYGSVSAAGELVMANCISNLTQQNITVAGSVISDISSDASVGALFGAMPNSSNIKAHDCHFIDSLSAGAAGSDVVLENLHNYPAAEFLNNNAILNSLNSFASAESKYTLNQWSLADGLPLTK